MAITLDGTTGITTPGLTNTGTTTIVALTTTGNTILGDATADTLNVGNGDLIKDASGNVGVGVTPSAWSSAKALEMGGGSSASYIAFNNTGTLQSYLYWNAFYNGTNNIYKATGRSNVYGVNASGEFVWFNAASGTAGNAITFTQAMTLDASGNLGIGTTTSTNRQTLQFSNTATTANSESGLSIYNSARGNNYQATVKFGSYESNNSTRWTAAEIGAAFTTYTDGANSGALLFSTSNAGTVAERARIDSSGNFGLGTTPSAWGSGRPAIEMNSTVSAYIVNNNTGALQLANNSYYNGSVNVTKVTGAGSAYSQYQGSHVWYLMASVLAGATQTFTQAMTLDASGNLLVGTTSTTIGTANFGVDVAASGGIFASRNENGSVVVFYTGGNAGAFRVLGNGNAQNTNNSYGAISDVKLKENIVDASPKLADLMQVKVRNYNLIGSTTKQIGVVAQELETVFPAMIDKTTDKDTEGNDLGTTTKSVKYSVFVPMLIKAMQEQQALIQSLTTRITALESK